MQKNAGIIYPTGGLKLTTPDAVVATYCLVVAFMLLSQPQAPLMIDAPVGQQSGGIVDIDG